MRGFKTTFFKTKFNVYFFAGVLSLFVLLNYIGISFFNDIDTQDVKRNRGVRSHYFYHHK